MHTKEKGTTVMQRTTKTIFVAFGLLLLLSTIVAVLAQIRPPNQIDISQTEKAAASIQASDRLVDQIGIFPPGYEEQSSLMVQEYEKVYGSTNTKVIEYQGYVLIVPPSKESFILDAQHTVDAQIAEQKAHTPSNSQQKKDRAVIRKTLGTEGITYDSLIGAYVDGDGYQYVLSNGILVNKSVGVTDSLRNEWERRHVLSSAIEMNSQLLTDEQTKSIAEEVVRRSYSDAREPSLQKQLPTQTKDRRMALDYGDVRVLIDRATGEIIHFSRDIR
jgi:hypothetical protein